MDADREDAARLCQGDTSGLAGLMSRHQDRLFRYLLRLWETRAWPRTSFSRPGCTSPSGSAATTPSARSRPWLVTVARNLALDQLRRQRPSSLDEADEPLAPASGSDPLEQAMARQSAARVEAALGGLGPLDREVLSLRFEDELELPELAATLGVPLPTAKARLYRALERLRAKLLAGAATGSAR